MQTTYKMSELKEMELMELNEILVSHQVEPKGSEEEAIESIGELFDIENDLIEEVKEFKPYMSEIQETKYYHKTDDEIINMRTGELLTAKDYSKLVEKSKKSSWELITESSPLSGDEIEAGAEVLVLDVSYVIEGKAFDYEIQIGLNTETNSIFALRYSEEKEQEHFNNYFEIDNSLLAIVNNLGNAWDDDNNVLDKEQVLNKIVACIAPEHIEIGDDKPSYQLEDGSIIFYDNQHENYKVKTYQTIDPIKKNNGRRTSLKSMRKKA